MVILPSIEKNFDWHGSFCFTLLSQNKPISFKYACICSVVVKNMFHGQQPFLTFLLRFDHLLSRLL